ncbi:MAG: bacteriohemerythrin [Rhodomicrobium sp.]
MPFAEWTDEFNIGIVGIDRDHRRLLELLNDLYDAIEAGDTRKVLGNVLDGLIAYVNYHFLHEETLLLRANYPDYDSHRQQHLALRLTVIEIHNEFLAREPDALSRQVLVFLKNWFYEHNLGADLAFSEYLSANRDKLEPRARPAGVR